MQLTDFIDMHFVVRLSEVYWHAINCFSPLQQHLKKVTEQFADDVEAWIELGQILEQIDVQVDIFSDLSIFI